MKSSGCSSCAQKSKRYVTYISGDLLGFNILILQN